MPNFYWWFAINPLGFERQWCAVHVGATRIEVTEILLLKFHQHGRCDVIWKPPIWYTVKFRNNCMKNQTAWSTLLFLVKFPDDSVLGGLKQNHGIKFDCILTTPSFSPQGIIITVTIVTSNSQTPVWSQRASEDGKNFKIIVRKENWPKQKKENPNKPYFKFWINKKLN